MRDITAKPDTLRTALAEAIVSTSDSVPALLELARADKGDALEIARIAGIMAAKKTWETIPFCHQIPVTHAGVTYAVSEHDIRVSATCTTVAPTGCEIEALNAASTAALTIYDVLKPHTDDMRIDGIRLLEKRGGKSDYASVPERAICVHVLTTTETASAEQERAVTFVCEAIQKLNGAELASAVTVACTPDALNAALDAATQAGAELILTIGGTGLSADDHTVDTVTARLDRQLPGVMEAVRAYGQRRTPAAMVSRGVAGVLNGTLVMTLPSTEGAAHDAMRAVFPGVLHIAEGVRGGEGDA